MDHQNIAAALGEQAQALLSLQRTVETMIQGRFGRTSTVRVADLKTISQCLRKGAEIADRCSILIEQEIEVQIPALKGC